MLLPDKDPHINTADKLLAMAKEAVEASDYERVTALSALAQAHIAISRHSETIDGLADVIEQLTNISTALAAQGPL